MYHVCTCNLCSTDQRCLHVWTCNPAVDTNNPKLLLAIILCTTPLVWCLWEWESPSLLMWLCRELLPPGGHPSQAGRRPGVAAGIFPENPPVAPTPGQSHTGEVIYAKSLANNCPVSLQFVRAAAVGRRRRNVRANAVPDEGRPE